MHDGKSGQEGPSHKSSCQYPNGREEQEALGTSLDKTTNKAKKETLLTELGKLTFS